MQDYRLVCDGSGTGVRDPRDDVVRCAVLEAPAPSRLHPAGAGGWESRRVRVERATLVHRRACDAWQHSDPVHGSEEDEGHQDHNANDIRTVEANAEAEAETGTEAESGAGEDHKESWSTSEEQS